MHESKWILTISEEVFKYSNVNSIYIHSLANLPKYQEQWQSNIQSSSMFNFIAWDVDLQLVGDSPQSMSSNIHTEDDEYNPPLL